MTKMIRGMAVEKPIRQSSEVRSHNVKRRANSKVEFSRDEKLRDDKLSSAGILPTAPPRI